MKNLTKTLFVSLVALSLSACATGKSYFFPKKAVAINGDNSFQIDTPKDRIVILYTQGSASNRTVSRCGYGAGMPDVIWELSGEELAGKKIIVHGYCPISTGDLTKGRSMSEARAPELEGIIQSYLEQGVPSNQIFVSGNSMGGWASVLVGARKKVDIGGFIAFAPANGIWTADKRTPNHWAAVDRQKSAVENLSRLDGQVFLFEGDPFNSPADLAFMKEIPGIEFYSESECGIMNPHKGFETACFETKYSNDISKYIEKRVTAGNNE